MEMGRLSFDALQPRPGPQSEAVVRGDRRPDGAFMGLSSGHVRGVNLLLLDGSVSLVTPAIDPKIWKEFARIGSPEKPQ